jgi:hypothetical protein
MVDAGKKAMSRHRRTHAANVVLRHQRQPDEPGSNLQIEVHRVRWRDLSSLRRIRQQIVLNQPNGHWRAADPFHAGMRQLMPFVSSADRVAVAQGSGRALGHAVFRVSPPDERWMLESIGSNTGVYEAEPIWEELLRYSIMAAGLEGAKRLYAKLPLGSSLISPARKTGFTPYATERILTATSLPVTSESASVRPQQASDVWSIHQLYMAVVPRQVQYAEALTSHHWDITAHRVRDERVSGWLMEDGNQIAGYVWVTTSVDRHALEFIVDPDHRSVVTELVRSVLAKLAAVPRRSMFAVVRTYQQEIIPVLGDVGFIPWLEQDVHVKYTTAPVQAPIVNGLPVTQELPEPVGKRVPTFYGTIGDPGSDPAGSTVRVFATTNHP